jgi:hypothetical protein
VRAAYKQLAEGAKKKHELEHPDYQYQPRKPSEKKRRMTKNKLAKLAQAQAKANGYTGPQQPLPDDLDAVTYLDVSLSTHASAHTMPLKAYPVDKTGQQPVIQPTSHPNAVAFNMSSDIEDRLRCGLQSFNEQYPPPQKPQPTPVQIFGNGVAGTSVTNPVNQAAASGPSRRYPTSAFVAQPVVDGKFVDDTTQYQFNFSAQTQDILRQPWKYATSPIHPVTSDTSTPRLWRSDENIMIPMALDELDPGAEAGRQDNLDAEFESFIDLAAVDHNLNLSFVEPANFASSSDELVEEAARAHTDHLPELDMYDMPNSFELDFSEDALNFSSYQT